MDALNLVSGTIDEIVDSIDCAVNTLLVHRDIFPRQDFFTVKKYNVPVLKTNNVQLKAYIERALGTLRYYLSKFKISTFVVVIMEKCSKSVVEGWQFIINVDDPDQPKSENPAKRMQQQLLNLLKYIDNTAECMTKSQMQCTFKMLLHPEETVELLTNGDDDEDA